MQKFVITLSGDKNRCSIDGFRGKGFTRFEAVDGYSIFAPTFLCTPAMLGCAASHVLLWRKLAASSDHCFLICEDDSLIQESDEFIVSEQDKPFIINLNPIGPFFSAPSSEHGCGALERRWCPLGTSCYIITRAAARQLVNLVDKINLLYHIDLQLAIMCWYLDIPIYISNVSIGVRENCKSTIGKKAGFTFLPSTVQWYAGLPITSFCSLGQAVLMSLQCCVCGFYPNCHLKIDKTILHYYHGSSVSNFNIVPHSF